MPDADRVPSSSSVDRLQVPPGPPRGRGRGSGAAVGPLVQLNVRLPVELDRELAREVIGVGEGTPRRTKQEIVIEALRAHFASRSA